MNKKHLITPALFLVAILTGCTNPGPFPDVELPVYQGALDVKKLIDSPSVGAKSVSYDIILDFPREQLSDFYTKEMGKIGFAPLPEEGIGTFKWEDFDYKKEALEEGGKTLIRYTATWVNKDKTQRIWLYIAPRREGKKFGNKYLVSCNMAKYFDMSGFKDEYRKRVNPQK